MNPISTLIFKWYLFLTVLAIFASTTIEFISVLSGFILAWFFFTVFFLGANSKITLTGYKLHHFNLRPNASDSKLFGLKSIALVSIFASLYAANFYTGKSPPEVVASLVLNVSLYNDYQQYFAQQNLAAMSVKKIPAIFSMFFMKFAAVYGFICVLVLRKKVLFSHCLCLLVIAMASLYFSIARGTSFEFFELMLLLWFSLSMRSIKHATRKVIFSRSRLFLVFMGVLALFAYSYNVSARYSFGDEIRRCITNELCLDSESVLFGLSSPLAMLSFKLSSYFTFGIYYTSHFVNEFLLASFSNLFMLMFPLSASYEEAIYYDFLCGVYLDCGASWIPDLILFVMNMGLIIVFLSIYLLGRFIRTLSTYVFSTNDFFGYTMMYLIFLSMVSLPIGNFLTISSANILLLVMTVCLFMAKKFFLSFK